MGLVVSMQKRMPARISSGCQSERGVAIVEAAIGLPALIISIFFLISLFLVLFTQGFVKIAINEAASEALRYQNSVSQLRVDFLKNSIIQKCGGFGITVNSNDIKICPVGSVCAAPFAGNANQRLKIVAKYTLFKLPILGDISFNVTAIVRNPPYFTA